MLYVDPTERARSTGTCRIRSIQSQSLSPTTTLGACAWDLTSLKWRSTGDHFHHGAPCGPRGKNLVHQLDTAQKGDGRPRAWRRQWCSPVQGWPGIRSHARGRDGGRPGLGKEARTTDDQSEGGIRRQRKLGAAVSCGDRSSSVCEVCATDRTLLHRSLLLPLEHRGERASSEWVRGVVDVSTRLVSRFLGLGPATRREVDVSIKGGCPD